MRKFTLIVAVLLTAFSCDLYDLDINVDPNNPTTGSPELLLPQIQADWAGDYDWIQRVGAGVMGQITTWDGLDFDQNSFNGTWRSIYLSEASDLDEYIRVTSEVDDDDKLINPGALAVGQILKAHIFSTLVDLWGDVPYSEAAQGNNDGNVNPAFDNQSVIYGECLALLDEAITNLGNAAINISGDLIYSGSRARWTEVAYSMKLRLLMTVRKAPGFTYGTGVNAEIMDLIDNHSGDLIDNVSNDYGFRWNTETALGQRHPWMGAVYGGDNDFAYISHQLMYEMLINHDPRIAYYFKRQTEYVLDQADPTDMNTTPCSQNSACIYGYMTLNAGVMGELQAASVISSTTGAADQAYMAGYFGRDKGDPSGIPLDGRFRTAPGVFPMGGQFDSGSPSKIDAVDGAGLGDGMTYFISAPMVSLYKMEAYIDIYNDPVLARAELDNFIDLSFEQVEDFSLSVAGTDAVSMANVATATDHSHVISPAAYKTNVLARYDLATTNGGRLNVVFKEAWYSLFGQGMELYNSHRRIDYPRLKTDQSGIRGIADIQYPTFRATSGSSAGQRNFPVRWPYPISEFNLNSNLTEILLSDGSTGIFWDPALFTYN